jgi:hypothetical protein
MDTRLPPADDADTTICVQTTWRSCGTYIWSKFRQRPLFHAYFEPCSEWLTAASAEAIHRSVRRTHRSDLRHGGMADSYFDEFPFASGGGVEYFQRRFSFENYYLPPDARDDDFERYIAFLLAHARSRQRVPVLKCCRYGLRAGWLDRVFRPSSIYVVRNPDAVFRSYWSFGGRRSYFLAASVLILAKNRNAAPFRELAARLSIPPISCPSMLDELMAACAVVERLEPQDLRDVVLLLWSLNLAHNSAVGCLVLDVDLLAESAAYREDVETRVSALVGAPMDFSDAVRPEVPLAPGVVLSEQGRVCARASIARLSPAADWSRMRVSPATDAVLAALA